MVHTRFDKSIEITDIENSVIDIKMRNNSKKTREFCNGKLLSIEKSDLLTVSAPTK